jgi:hypothetical protein
MWQKSLFFWDKYEIHEDCVVKKYNYGMLKPVDAPRNHQALDG